MVHKHVLGAGQGDSVHPELFVEHNLGHIQSQNALSKQAHFIPLKVLNSREDKGKPIHKRLGFVRAEARSCKFCPLLPPFRTRSGWSTHMLDQHGINSDGDSEGEEEEDDVELLKRSRQDIPGAGEQRERVE